LDACCSRNRNALVVKSNNNNRLAEVIFNKLKLMFPKSPYIATLRILSSIPCEDQARGDYRMVIGKISRIIMTRSYEHHSPPEEHNTSIEFLFWNEF
jgi:hypothetical protein